MGSRAALAGEQRQRSFTELRRRQQIVDEAIRVIAESGYSRASLGQIALRLKISKGIISYHFAKKDELIQEIISTTLAEGARFMSGYLGRAQSPAGELRAYIEGEIAFLKAHRNHAIALVEIYNARVADYAPHRKQFLAALQEQLEKGQRTGEFRPFAARIMAITIRAAIEAVPHLLVETPDFDLDAYAEELMQTFDAATRTVPERGHVSANE
ncbi:MAG: TetR/AcrR family transcriptional regulator [Dehalococcoidia bacterium]